MNNKKALLMMAVPRLKLVLNSNCVPSFNWLMVFQQWQQQKQQQPTKALAKSRKYIKMLFVCAL